MVNADEPPRIGTDEDYRRIETAAGIETPNHRFRHRLDRCIERWDYHSEPDYSNVRQATFLKAVRQLKTDAEHLLRDLTYPTYIGDDQSEQARALGDAVDFLGASDVLVQDLHELVEQANETLDVMPPDKGGRPADVEFQMLIRTLAKFYMKETKKKPSVTWDHHGEHARYSGAFFDFVEACCRVFAPRYAIKTNQALGKATQRALKKLPVSL